MGTGLKCQGAIYKTFLDTVNNNFYAGGYFDAIENIEASSIAMWDGVQWNSLGAGIVGSVFDIEIYNNELYVVGDFTEAGGAIAGNIAKWDGAQWLNVGNSGTGAQINELEEFNGKLYICGPFQYIDGVSARYAAVFDGSTWSPLGAGFDYAPIDISKSSDKIYFSGLFNFLIRFLLSD
ncbi:MAG: hypothetical protein IPK10_18415 [Bacteroidetes bacterium]|nr:hypothetical protein [Bacteroidota bacterium]